MLKQLFMRKCPFWNSVILLCLVDDQDVTQSCMYAGCHFIWEIKLFTLGHFYFTWSCTNDTKNGMRHGHHKTLSSFYLDHCTSDFKHGPAFPRYFTTALFSLLMSVPFKKILQSEEVCPPMLCPVFYLSLSATLASV